MGWERRLGPDLPNSAGQFERYPLIAVWNAVWTENWLLPGARFPQFFEGKGTDRSLVSGSVVVVVTTNKRT